MKPHIRTFVAHFCDCPQCKHFMRPYRFGKYNSEKNVFTVLTIPKVGLCDVEEVLAFVSGARGITDNSERPVNVVEIEELITNARVLRTRRL